MSTRPLAYPFIETAMIIDSNHGFNSYSFQCILIFLSKAVFTNNQRMVKITLRLHKMNSEVAQVCKKFCQYSSCNLLWISTESSVTFSGIKVNSIMSTVNTLGRNSMEK